MKPIRPLFAAAGVLAVAIAALAYAAEPAPPRPPGYLPVAAVPNTAAIITPPPPMGSWAESRDRSVFLATRSMEGSPRWELAARDAVQSTPALTHDFACALGVEADPVKAPRLNRLLDRVLSDARTITDKSKDFYGKKRPYLLYGGPTCVEGPTTASYPSGHTTVSWAYGTILAELFPDRSEAILTRARAYGESRVVCGVHTVSDIEAGRVNGSVLVSLLHSNPEFMTDLNAARIEVAALREAATPLPPERAERCAIEAEASANRPW